MQIKEIATYLKIIPIKKDSSTPFTIQIAISPLECIVDVTQLVFELNVDSFESISAPRVFVSSKANELIPQELLDEIENLLNAKIRMLFKSDGGESWHLFELVEWAIENFQVLVFSVPSCFDFYMTEGPSGESIRRWALVTCGEGESQEEEEEDEEAREYWRRKREDEAKDREREKEREADLRRLEVIQDPSLHAKVKILSLKEQQELKEARNKQGVRLGLQITLVVFN